jgi:hypothetical protein
MRRVKGFAGGVLLLSLAAPAFGQPAYGPPAPAAPAQSHRLPQLTGSASAERASRAPLPFVGAISPDGDAKVGLGLFRVPKVNASDPNRNNPMRDRTGRSTKVAAFGASFRF